MIAGLGQVCAIYVIGVGGDFVEFKRAGGIIALIVQKMAVTSPTCLCRKSTPSLCFPETENVFI
jgi:hypothetical protein